jgi:hypothetical protein
MTLAIKNTNMKDCKNVISHVKKSKPITGQGIIHYRKKKNKILISSDGEDSDTNPSDYRNYSILIRSR